MRTALNTHKTVSALNKCSYYSKGEIHKSCATLSDTAVLVKHYFEQFIFEMPTSKHVPKRGITKLCFNGRLLTPTPIFATLVYLHRSPSFEPLAPCKSNFILPCALLSTGDSSHSATPVAARRFRTVFIEFLVTSPHPMPSLPWLQEGLTAVCVSFH